MYVYYGVRLCPLDLETRVCVRERKREGEGVEAGASRYRDRQLRSMFDVRCSLFDVDVM